MSDFLLSFGKLSNTPKLSDYICYFDDIEVRIFEEKHFTLILSRPDDWSLWGPYISDDRKIHVFLAGRIALDESEWKQSLETAGNGGVACKAIFDMYQRGGISELAKLNGNYVVLIFDDRVNRAYIITDRCGMFPCYIHNDSNKVFSISSHPDLLAQLSNKSHEWDLDSFSEFLATGKISFPFTYYKDIHAMDFGSIHVFKPENGSVEYHSKIKYFDFDYQIDHGLTEWELAEELASSFRKAVNRRSLPIFGKTAVSLSGGLDSRSFLCALCNKADVVSFCFFDVENLEFKIAEQIANTAGVHLHRLNRDFDHYGKNAELGIKISGGMGDFGNNHYLGFRRTFIDLGIQNIIAGFYCDYLFKGLVLNKKKHTVSRREQYSAFRYENYMPIFWFETAYGRQVRERLDSLFPEDVKRDESELGRLMIEQRRLFPLYSEPDNQETLVPQRVLGWSLPIVDNDIINTYLRIPPRYKLNTSMYSKMVQIVCGDAVSDIINTNTGAKVGASTVSLIAHGYLKSIKGRLARRKQSIATEESWPNWEFYIHHSKVIEALWSRKNDVSIDVFKGITGSDPYDKNIRQYVGVELKLFLRLLTLKLWIDQRMNQA